MREPMISDDYGIGTILNGAGVARRSGLPTSKSGVLRKISPKSSCRVPLARWLPQQKRMPPSPEPRCRLAAVSVAGHLSLNVMAKASITGSNALLIERGLSRLGRGLRVTALDRGQPECVSGII